MRTVRTCCAVPGKGHAEKETTAQRGHSRDSPGELKVHGGWGQEAQGLRGTSRSEEDTLSTSIPSNQRGLPKDAWTGASWCSGVGTLRAAGQPVRAVVMPDTGY